MCSLGVIVALLLNLLIPYDAPEKIEEGTEKDDEMFDSDDVKAGVKEAAPPVPEEMQV